VQIERGGKVSETRIKVTDIALEKLGDKFWVKVYFDDGTNWVPKLTEVAKVFSGLGKAETAKYPKGKGWLMVKEFMDECWNKTKSQIDEIYITKFDPNGVTKESIQRRKELDDGANKGWENAAPAND